MGTQWTDGYSAEVELFLVVDGERLPLSHVRDKDITLRNGRNIPSNTAAQLVIIVDGRADVHEVVLPTGATESQDTLSYL
jgi:hypothetical protein